MYHNIDDMLYYFQNFYSFVLVDGKVEGRFSTNSLPKKITTSKTFNDGHLHNVAIQKVGNRYVLKIYYLKVKYSKKWTLEKMFCLSKSKKSFSQLWILHLNYRTTVYVDDEAQLEEAVLVREEVNVDHLYIGGVINYNFPQGQAMAATTKGLEGCISDIIINQR